MTEKEHQRAGELAEGLPLAQMDISPPRPLVCPTSCLKMEPLSAARGHRAGLGLGAVRFPKALANCEARRRSPGTKEASPVGVGGGLKFCVVPLTSPGFSRASFSVSKLQKQTGANGSGPHKLP